MSMIKSQVQFSDRQVNTHVQQPSKGKKNKKQFAAQQDGHTPSMGAPAGTGKKKHGKRAHGGGACVSMSDGRNQLTGGGSVEDYSYLLGFKSHDEPNELL